MAYPLYGYWAPGSAPRALEAPDCQTAGWASETVNHSEPFPDVRGVIREDRVVTCRRGCVECPHHPTPPFDRPLPLAIGTSHLFGDRPKGHDLDLRRLDNAAWPLRTIQQHTKRTYEWNLAVG